jgi:MraZ protein
LISFLGEYESTLDTKGRFLLPAGFKKQLPEEAGNVFVINRGFEKCLALYPKPSWDPIFERISKLNDFEPNVRDFRRYFLNGAIEVELDSASRFNIPKNLAVYAGLEKDIVLVSAVDKLEIWDKKKYEQLFDNFEPSKFSSLAASVMGGASL